MKIGILGGGQLARMLALAAIPMGHSVLCLDPAKDACAKDATTVLTGDFDDMALLDHFASQVDVITLENENIPTQTIEHLKQTTRVYPDEKALSVCQDRLHEKQSCQQYDLPTPRFWEINIRDDLIQALKESRYPAVLKTRRFGYDGKGQYVLKSDDDIESAWEKLGNRELILEAWVPFTRELSFIGVRNTKGDFQFYPLTENHHIDGILHRSIAPAKAHLKLQIQAKKYLTTLMNAFDYVGVLAVELFEVDGTLLINEMAPRVHNSGHWTIEGAAISQFENHVRAITGMPLGCCDPIGFSAMVNAIGSEPDTNQLLAVSCSHYHTYAKMPREGRKVGHVTVHTSYYSELTSHLKDVEVIPPFNRR